jgi:virginiamycin B lyase
VFRAHPTHSVRSHPVRSACAAATLVVALAVPAVTSGITAAPASAHYLPPMPAPTSYASWHEVDLTGVDPYASALTTDDAGAVWYAEADSQAIVRYEPATKATTVYPTGDVATTMVMGHDGRLWSNSISTHDLIVLDPASGTVTKHPIRGIATALDIGADGAVWFSDPGHREIGRVDDSGTVSTFAVPSGLAADELTVTTDDRVWFSQSGSTDLGVFDPESAVFSVVPTTLTDVTGLTATPAGAIWVGGPDMLVKLHLDGTVDRAIAVTSRWTVLPKALTPGVHSEIYFRDTDLGIGFLDPADVAHWNLSPFDGSAPMQLSVTPDGVLWFTHKFHPTLGSV